MPVPSQALAYSGQDQTIHPTASTYCLNKPTEQQKTLSLVQTITHTAPSIKIFMKHTKTGSAVTTPGAFVQRAPPPTWPGLAAARSRARRSAVKLATHAVEAARQEKRPSRSGCHAAATPAQLTHPTRMPKHGSLYSNKHLH